MHGLQLWVALPDAARDGEPRFEHHAALPVLVEDGVTITVLVGEFGGARSPAAVHTPLLGVEVVFAAAGVRQLALDPGFEHGVVVMSGAALAAGTAVGPGSLLYLSPGRDEVVLEATGPARVLLLGGEPFAEDLVMWWNFVGRSHDDIARAREDWAAGRRFGRVEDCSHAPLPAPELPSVRLKARDRHGRVRR
jgi:hypothetical protein